MIIGSICSGIAADAVAWHPLGWRHAWFAEIEPKARAVLNHHYRDVPNHGDFTKIRRDTDPIDVLVGGTPCQSFSVAGRRAGLDDPRGVLAFEFLKLADRLRPKWLVFENVPGLLSSDRGRDFGSWLGSLAKLGYGWAYRVLDAQYFGVPQRRRRVFVVGHLGGLWQRAVAVLFDSRCLSGDSPPRRQAMPSAARETQGVFGVGGEDVARAIHCNSGGSKFGSGRDACETFVTGAIRPGGKNGSNEMAIPLVAHSISSVGHDAMVRRLTPREVERCFGLPDDYTLVPYRGRMMSDSGRYQICGNSIAVPVLRWIGERIRRVQ